MVDQILLYSLWAELSGLLCCSMLLVVDSADNERLRRQRSYFILRFNLVYQVLLKHDKLLRKPEMPSRLLDKLKAASQVAIRQHQKIEARADAIIAREEVLEALTDKSFKPHEAKLTEAEKGLADLESSLAVLTNGGDPLPDTKPGVQSTHPLVTDAAGKVVG